MDELANLLDQTEVTTNNGLDATKAPRLSQWKGETIIMFKKFLIK